MDDLTPIYGTVIGLDVQLKQVTATALLWIKMGKLISRSEYLVPLWKILGKWLSGAKA
jgi:hypothetical protein